jgi:hypothetical protein
MILCRSARRSTTRPRKTVARSAKTSRPTIPRTFVLCVSTISSDVRTRLRCAAGVLLTRVRFETEGPFKPSMCEQSRLLAKEARARGQNTSRSARRPADQTSYTFAPSLSKAGSIHNRRGTSDMAKDAARIEAHRQQLRDDKDRAESKLLTFKPALEPPPKAYSKIVSVLSQRNLPNLHKRLKAKEAQRESVRTQAQEKRDEKERAACTFRPVLNGVPVYVADMARSAQVLRGALIV